jgi:hypothetical protein
MCRGFCWDAVGQCGRGPIDLAGYMGSVGYQFLDRLSARPFRGDLRGTTVDAHTHAT